MDTSKYRLTGKKTVSLKDFDPDETSEYKGSKKKAKEELAKIVDEISQLQEKLYAEGKQKLLIIIQTTDTGGKDGTIRAIFSGVNPQGVKVASFKVPTPIELAHDYLWRIHHVTPGKGEIVVFNRSHYEDVLPVRVHKLVPEVVWSKRYDHIVSFEQLLTDEGTTILKFYLHISKEEQAVRLIERIMDPTKTWKFNPGDLEERKLWNDYQEAYEDVLNKTSTPKSPWYVIPANRNWYRNLLVATIIRDTLKGLNCKYPENKEDLQPYYAVLKTELEKAGIPLPDVPSRRPVKDEKVTDSDAADSKE
ncbi:MAG TPA: polyphosphate kinase 2 family protein [Anaerolineaceae bacterium]|nr:polyphosphate kinase 2 family protein [Anaerolineaceae bacterium]